MGSRELKKRYVGEREWGLRGGVVGWRGEGASCLAILYEIVKRFWDIETSGVTVRDGQPRILKRNNTSNAAFLLNTSPTFHTYHEQLANNILRDLRILIHRFTDMSLRARHEARRSLYFPRDLFFSTNSEITRLNLRESRTWNNRNNKNNANNTYGTRIPRSVGLKQ